MVRGVDHDGVVGDLGLSSASRTMPICLSAHSPARSTPPGRASRFRRHPLEPAVVAEVLVVERQRVQVPGRDRRGRDLVLVVFQEARGCGERVVGCNEPDREEERPPRGLAVLQEVRRGVPAEHVDELVQGLVGPEGLELVAECVAVVAEEVGGQAGPRPRLRCPGRGGHRLGRADPPGLLVDDLVAVRLAPLVVHLADEVRLVPGSVQDPGEARCPLGDAAGVGPDAVAGDVLPGGERLPGRGADRGRAVVGVEHDTSAARASRCGVRATSLPAHPITPAWCSSDMMTMMFGGAGSGCGRDRAAQREGERG